MTPADTLRWHVVRLLVLKASLVGEAQADVDKAVTSLNTAAHRLDPRPEWSKP